MFGIEGLRMLAVQDVHAHLQQPACNSSASPKPTIKSARLQKTMAETGVNCRIAAFHINCTVLLSVVLVCVG